MQVHQIVNSYSLSAGGAERIVRVLHQELSRRGIDSRLFGIRRLASKSEEISFATSGSARTPYSITAFIDLYQYVSKYVHKEDIVHAHLFPTGFYLALLKKMGILRSVLVYTEHSTSNRRRGTFKGRLIDSIAYSEYSRIFSISKGVKDELIEWLPWLKQRVRVVYNGTRFPFFKEIERQNGSKLVILSIGRLAASKNYETALRAMALVKSTNFEYWIAGGGDKYDSLKRLSEELGIANKVRFLGHVNDIVGLLKLVDIFLIPSLWEGFGLAAVEAMNASLPVVASDINGLREVVEHEPSCAIFINPHSSESIARALNELIASTTMRISMGKNAFLHSKKYSCDFMVNGYISEYDEILKSNQ